MFRQRLEEYFDFPSRKDEMKQVELTLFAAQKVIEMIRCGTGMK
jgi:hypothetical protein